MLNLKSRSKFSKGLPKLIIQLFIILLALCVTACSSGGAGGSGGGTQGMGKFSIRVGSSSAGRALWNDLETDEFTHTIKLTNGPGADQSVTIPPEAASKTANFTVTPGTWTITIEGIYDGETVSTGSATKEIKAGENGSINIKMGKTGFEFDYGDDTEDEIIEPVDPNDPGTTTEPDDYPVFDQNDYDEYYYVSNLTDWEAAVLDIQTNTIDSDFAIVLNGDVTDVESGYTDADFGTTTASTNKNITIFGDNHKISLISTGVCILYITSNQTVTIVNVNLQGNTTGDNFVSVRDGGTLIMYGGSIYGNRAVTSGAGVHISGGTFIMHSGSIHSNTNTANAGGVYVGNSSSSTFIMNGGSIYGNSINATSNGRGGGVWVNSGEFTMNGGSIYDNRTTGASSDSMGGGVYVGGYGGATFNLNAPKDSIHDNTAANGTEKQVYFDTTNATDFFYIDGVLQTVGF